VSQLLYPEGADPSADAAEAGDCRCLCGSLLARWVEGGVELKCRRCKRTVHVPLAPPGRPAREARSLATARLRSGA
jgi:hypothetical protein